MIRILPAVLAQTEDEYKLALQRIQATSSLENTWVHIDLIDNEFVSGISIAPEILLDYPLSLNKQMHLMVSRPSEWLEKLVKFSPSQVIAHIEINQEELDLFFELAKKININTGLALNPDTPIEKISPFIGKIKSILIMGVEPGKQGQEFIEPTFNKLSQVKKEGWGIEVGVDGGVDSGNIKTLAEIGVDYAAIGSNLLKGDIDENLERLWEALYK